MARATCAILSTDNLWHNLGVLRARAGKAKILAMVKANAYGHGLRSVAQRLDGRVDALGVASVDEAMALRQAGVQAPVVLMEGVFAPEELDLAAAHHFHVVFHEELQLSWLAQARLSAPLVAWLKVDTGMGRLGFDLAQAEAAYRMLAASSNVVQPVGIMSHFACADEPEHLLNARQIAAFGTLAALGEGPRSLCNSAGIFAFAAQHGDWVRPGLALYGASPLVGQSATALGLKPVMTVQTRLIAVRTMKAGATLGYGARFVCPADMKVGVMAIGYGDGYPRTAREGTPVLVKGVRCALVGRVSMDMATVDLRACPEAEIGDPVVLWGDGLPVEDVATMSGHVAYDLFTGVQARVKFQWTPFA